MRGSRALTALLLTILACPFSEAAARSADIFAVFDSLDMPKIAGREFIRYTIRGYVTENDAGERITFEHAKGWLIAESDEKVTLLGADLMSDTFRRKNALPARWDEFKHAHPKDEALPGQWRKVDYEAYCRGFLAAAGNHDTSWDALARRTRGELPRPAKAALLAYWARELGHVHLAAALMRHAGSSVRESWYYRKESKGGLPGFVTKSVAENLRWRAINAAHRGASFRSLIDMWLDVAGLPRNKLSREAEEMVAQYRAIIAEDEEREAPGGGDLAAATPAQRVAHWMWALRDLDARQMMQPGMCRVTGVFSGVEAPNPADKLVELGWDALPEVIRHLDDPRPTRSVGYWRDFSIGSFYLLRYGDCCQQIFLAIAGKRIYRRRTTSGYPMLDGKGHSAKEAALRWWESNKDDPAGHFERLFAQGSAREQDFAAEQLLRIDAGKYLSIVMAKARTEAAHGSTSMLWSIAPRLGREMLKKLVESSHLDVVLAAARELRRYDDESGVAVLARRLRSLTADQARGSSFVAMLAFDLIGKAPSEPVAREMCSLVMHHAPDVRQGAIHEAGAFAFERVAKRLVSHFGDEGETGARQNGIRVRWCDAAAQSFCEATACPVAFDMARPVAERDETIARVGAWWSRKGAALDWPELRRRVRERLAAAEQGE